jgi:hypothetical protein
MEKFKYKKWVTDYKHGLLTEQTGSPAPGTGSFGGNATVTSYMTGSATGSATGSGAPTCFYCNSGSFNNPINPPQAGSGPANYNSYWCTSTYNQSQTPCYTWLSNYQGATQQCMTGQLSGFIDPNHALLSTCTGSVATGSACNVMPTSPCAQTWFGNNANNFANWMSSKDCSNYQSVINNLSSQFQTLWQNRPNQNALFVGPQSFNDIKDLANDAGFNQPQKGQFKRKASKAYYTYCQHAACC